MSRQNLTNTEELEKLEQTITLTLQEIDHNFSRAHTIVTTSILPIVEQYANHSEAVWEGSKFWKQFFEASANVSLSSIEETDATAFVNQPLELDDENSFADTGSCSDSSYQMTSSSAAPEDSLTSSNVPEPPHYQSNSPSESELVSTLLSSPSSTPTHQSTPRPPFHDLPSITPMHFPPQTPSQFQPSPTPKFATATKRKTPAKPLTNPVLHHVLDKTYRVATTPLTAQRDITRRWHDLGLDLTPQGSSPIIAPPELRHEIFNSPLKTPRRADGFPSWTPARLAGDDNKDGAVLGDFDVRAADRTEQDPIGVWDSDDDADGCDFSPPKTIQFHVPQRRLLQTPAREASKRIVKDILLTAGGDITDELPDDDGSNSPSIVGRRKWDISDTF